VHTPWYLFLGIVVAWAAVWLSILHGLMPWLSRRVGSGPLTGFLWLVARTYTRAVHRVRYVGFDRLPPYACAGGTRGFIVVANHACGIDPLLVQCGLRRHVRWMMWFSMFAPVLGPLWRHERMIAVGRGPKADGVALREAVRHVRGGDPLGIFPEGGIARPPGEVRPFLPGTGFLARLAKAPVLLFHINRTGFCETAWGSIITPSRSTVEFLGEFDLSHIKDPTLAVEHLREVLAARSGWPLNDESALEAEDGSTL
jgi:1-acyl-sn-glycerol-3-phosphate acyltransferase